MPEYTPSTEIHELTLDDLQSSFLSLRVGEEIPRLEIKCIRKIINKTKSDNLAGVDYKYIIESRQGKILTVNSWLLWKRIAAALQQAGRIEATLELKHPAVETYSVRVV
jgi:hypothetical protein